MADKLTQAQEQYLEWLLLDNAQRVLGKLPTTEAGFAKGLKVGDRTLRTWRKLPHFQEALTARQEALVGKHTPAKTIDLAAIASAEHNDVEQYEAIKAQVVAGALAKDKDALKLYFSTYARPHLEAEAAARNTDLAGFTTEELVLELCVIAKEEELADYLTSKGWTCVAPEALDA